MSNESDTAASRLAAIVQSSDDAIVSKDLNGLITTWNPAAERLFGYTAAEAIGRSIRIVIPHDRQAEEDDVLSRIRRGESVAHFETIRQRRDGTQFPILTYGARTGTFGNPTGVADFTIDYQPTAVPLELLPG
jgi:PAS domain S-box-containing protein